MKAGFNARWFGLIAIAVMLFSQFPPHAVLADSGSELYGTVQALPATGLVGDWTVSGQTIHVNAATKISQEHGNIAVGATVKVDGDKLADNSINAREIEVKSGPGGTGESRDFYGTIQSLPAAGLIGDWKVDTRTVHVTSATRIDQEHGAPAMGSYVEVKGAAQADGSINATEIGVQSESGNASTHIEVIGVVTGLPLSGLIGDWQVNGQKIHVLAATKISLEHGSITLGTIVKVEGVKLADNSINAGEIEVQSSSSVTGSSAEFLGNIQSLPATGLIGDWQVSGKTVHVSASAKITQERAKAAVGAFVKVDGTQQSDGSINAKEIEVRSTPSSAGGTEKYVKLYGAVQSLPSSGLIGDWKVNGFIVHVIATTVIDKEHGAPVMGSAVEIKGLQQADGSINAAKVEVKDANGASAKRSKLFGQASAFSRSK